MIRKLYNSSKGKLKRFPPKVQKALAVVIEHVGRGKTPDDKLNRMNDVLVWMLRRTRKLK